MRFCRPSPSHDAPRRRRRFASATIATIVAVLSGGVPPRVAAGETSVPAPTDRAADYREFDQPPHRYFERTPTDRFSRMKADLEAGRIPLDRSSEKAFLTGLLEYLGVPATSQMLLFSTTSLQLSRIHPGNPRALYFSDDLYLGFIPGGRLEVVALDPELGAVFYIFDIPRGDEPIRVERSARCMNCHAGDDTGHVPGLVIQSVVPGPSGGSLDAFRRGQSGHGVPLEQRFGGWYVTGAGDFTNHWGNALGRFVEGEVVRIPTFPDARIRPERYPLPTSDLLPQLIHEHQVGFVNRAVEAGYRARTHLHTDGSRLTAAHARELEEQAEILTRYLLFRDEVPLPPGGVSGDSAFRRDFARGGRVVDGMSLRDLDLQTRLLRHRCSYMIHSPVFEGLPSVVKDRVLQRLASALDPGGEDPVSRHLPAAEREVLRRILRATLPGFLPGG